jgi:chorismate lyase/3-hydroxybenzoate synthase
MVDRSFTKTGSFMSLAPAMHTSFQLGLPGVETSGGAGRVGVPVLAGSDVEALFSPGRSIERAGAFTVYEAGEWRIGAASLAVDADLEEATCGLYRDLFSATASWHLARVWNYVPAINQAGPGGLENYRIFCRGRSLAFEGHHGRGYKALLPAASAVGCKTRQLTVVFAARRSLPRHVENPLQVPAYDYPADYGPRAPSFARATVVGSASSPALFVSGTAAIRGHVTVAPGDTLRQVETTLENLFSISEACGLGRTLTVPGAARRHVKVYLRFPEDLSGVRAKLERVLLREDDVVSYLHADICRQALNVEIELSAI